MSELTPDFIRTADRATLFPYLARWVEMWHWEATEYLSDPKPMQWFMSLDGNARANCDLTVYDCGNEERGAMFVRAIMHAGMKSGASMSLRYVSPDLGYEDEDDKWVDVDPVWEATADTTDPARAVTAWGDSAELALLRAYLLYQVMNTPEATA